MAKSRSFSAKSAEFSKMSSAVLQNKFVLYFVFILAVGNLFNFVFRQDLMSVGVLLATGLLTSFFSKNMVVIMIIAMVVANVVQFGNRDGFQTKKEKDFEEAFEKVLDEFADELGEGFEDDDGDDEDDDEEEDEEEKEEEDEDETEGFRRRRRIKKGLKPEPHQHVTDKKVTSHHH
jgi:hypothetical protein